MRQFYLFASCEKIESMPLVGRMERAFASLNITLQPLSIWSRCIPGTLRRGAKFINLLDRIDRFHMAAVLESECQVGDFPMSTFGEASVNSEITHHPVGLAYSERDNVSLIYHRLVRFALQKNLRGWGSM
jgi:hypothetical protein